MKSELEGGRRRKEEDGIIKSEFELLLFASCYLPTVEIALAIPD